MTSQSHLLALLLPLHPFGQQSCSLGNPTKEKQRKSLSQEQRQHLWAPQLAQLPPVCALSGVWRPGHP